MAETTLGRIVYEKGEGKMKAYYVTFAGKFLGGWMIVTAETERKAFNSAVAELKKEGLWEKNKETFNIKDLVEIKSESRGVWEIYNGSY